MDEKIKVDLIVIGSVAVDPKTGARLGKGRIAPGFVRRRSRSGTDLKNAIRTCSRVVPLRGRFRQ